AHQFVEERHGAMWAFQHNGSLLRDTGDSEKIDSQVLFETLLDHLDDRSREGVAQATKAARAVVIDKFGGFTGLNFMLSDGTALHVYRDFQTNGQYYTLYVDDLGEMVIAASEPILAMQAEPTPRGILHSVNGDLVVQRATIA